MSDDLWARVGYAARPSHRGYRAVAHLMTGGTTRVSSFGQIQTWITSCGLQYDSYKVADPEPEDKQCGNCSLRGEA